MQGRLGSPLLTNTLIQIQMIYLTTKQRQPITIPITRLDIPPEYGLEFMLDSPNGRDYNFMLEDSIVTKHQVLAMIDIPEIVPGEYKYRLYYAGKYYDEGICVVSDIRQPGDKELPHNYETYGHNDTYITNPKLEF